MEVLFENKTYAIIGLCMEVYKISGHGLSEMVHNEAMVHEANLKNAQFERKNELKI